MIGTLTPVRFECFEVSIGESITKTAHGANVQTRSGTERAGAGSPGGPRFVKSRRRAAATHGAFCLTGQQYAVLARVCAADRQGQTVGKAVAGWGRQGQIWRKSGHGGFRAA